MAMKATMMHEIFHAMVVILIYIFISLAAACMNEIVLIKGFSQGQYKYFLSPTGQEQAESKVIRKVQRMVAYRKSNGGFGTMQKTVLSFVMPSLVVSRNITSIFVFKISLISS